jgi:hypothetical protein
LYNVLTDFSKLERSEGFFAVLSSKVLAKFDNLILATSHLFNGH